MASARESHQGMLIATPLLLVATVRWRRWRCAARPNAKRSTRSVPWRLNTDSWITISRSVPGNITPPRLVYSPSVFSRTIRKSISARLATGQRTGHAVEQAHRPQIDVLVEFAPELDQAAPERDIVGHAGRPADGAEIDRVHAFELLLPVGHHVAVAGVVVAAGPVDVGQLQLDAEALRRGLQDAQALGHHFLADAVTRDDGDAMDGTHGKLPVAGGHFPQRQALMAG